MLLDVLMLLTITANSGIIVNDGCIANLSRAMKTTSFGATSLRIKWTTKKASAFTR
jgi:hypothetical protein